MHLKFVQKRLLGLKNQKNEEHRRHYYCCNQNYAVCYDIISFSDFPIWISKRGICGTDFPLLNFLFLYFFHHLFKGVNEEGILILLLFRITLSITIIYWLFCWGRQICVSIKRYLISVDLIIGIGGDFDGKFAFHSKLSLF